MRTLSILVLLCTILYAGSYEPNAVDQEIINLTFNEEYGQAKKILNEQIKNNPDIPKYYYYLINLKVLEYYQRITDMHPDKRDEGRKALNKEIINYCESIIDKFENVKLNTENKFYYGSIYGYLARIQGIDKSWWGAFKSGKKTEDIMEEVLKEDSKFYDAYLLLGMLNYYADRLSGVTSFVAGILGYSGDREKGLQQLKLAYEKGKLTFGQSALTLIEVYASLEDNDYAAIEYYEKFLEQYPNNKRILNSYFQKLLNAGEYSKAEKILKNDNNKLLEDYTIAIYYDAKGNSALALEFAEKTIANKNKLWRGWLDYIYYIAAVNSKLVGDNTKYAKYEKELDDNFKIVLDEMKRNPSGFKWLNDLSAGVANNISTGEFETIIKSKPGFSKTAMLEDQFNLLAGKFYFSNKMYFKAEQYFAKCFDTDDKGILYNALKYTTDIYYNQKTDKQKVERLLDKIDDFDNDRLAYRAKDLEKKYNL